MKPFGLETLHCTFQVFKSIFRAEMKKRKKKDEIHSFINLNVRKTVEFKCFLLLMLSLLLTLV